MLFRQSVVVRLWPRVATVSAAMRTLTSRITVRDAVAAASTREDVSVLVSRISVYYSGYHCMLITGLGEEYEEAEGACLH